LEASYKATSLEPSKYDNAYIKVIEVDTCPRCKKSIKPQHLNTVYLRTTDKTAIVESHLFCNGCNSSFLAHYELFMPTTNSFQATNALYVAPNNITSYQFDAHISTLSSQFVKIYNQALAAEMQNLDEIAGLGYRKSLEFLIKDFAISEHPEEVENIKSMQLSLCIKNYIDDIRIKTLSEKSAWIGNDEAHYIRKQENRDVSDMKTFIQAAVYFISMVLITKDAESIERK